VSSCKSAAVGGRIKYLVDTPETLWGCLDAGSFLAAAHRYLRASLVYEALQGGDAASAMRQFPLVRTQWPLVAKFRSDASAQSCCSYYVPDAWGWPRMGLVRLGCVMYGKKLTNFQNAYSPT
jgi:hypothetical protein